jgi:predicted nucleic acid-binding protein
LSFVAPEAGVIAEYVDLDGDLHEEAERVLNSALKGDLVAVIPHVVFCELYYVSYRIYEKSLNPNPSLSSEKLVSWLYKSPNVVLAEQSLELAIESGKVKKEYGLSLPDSCVMAMSKIHNGKALFKKREREMSSKVTKMQRNYDVLFLEDYEGSPTWRTV